MISRGLRSFGTTAGKAADVASRVHSANPYGVQVAKAQRHVDGFVGGRPYRLIFSFHTLIRTG